MTIDRPGFQPVVLQSLQRRFLEEMDQAVIAAMRARFGIFPSPGLAMPRDLAPTSPVIEIVDRPGIVFEPDHPGDI